MKIFGALGALVILLIVGAFGFIAFTDVQIEQKTVVKDIPTDNLVK